MVVKKKLKRVRATPRQKKLVKAVVDNLGKKGKAKPMGTLMREVGYSKAQSKNPQQIINSPTFQQLLEISGCTDKLLTDTLVTGLKHPGKGNGAAIVRHTYLKTGLTLKNHLKPAGEELADAFAQMVQFQLPRQKELPKE